MANFRTITVPIGDAPSVEAELRAQGYRERPGVKKAELGSREYSKRTGGSDPNTFGGPQVVTFNVRES